ncbi:MAG: hypothetical protein U1E36_00510 [Rickettsiales bacterium]
MLPELLYHPTAWHMDLPILLAILCAGGLLVAGWLYRLMGSV